MSESKYTDELLQKASDLKQQYHKEQFKTDWSEVEEILQGQGFNIVCDENFRCAVKRYESKNGILKKREEVINESIDIKNKELIAQKIEIDFKKQQLRDELTYVNKNKRPLSRTEAMCEVLKEVTSPLPIQKQFNIITPSKNRKIMVVLLSDAQVGEMLKTNDTAGFNEYNFDVFKSRMQKYLNEIISDCKELGINEIQLCQVGDDVEGTGNIYKKQKFYLESHVVKQIFDVSDSNALFIKSLYDNGIYKINTMAVSGNHGNVGYDNHELANFDILAFDRTKLLLNDYKDINYQYSNSFMEVVNILGYNFLLLHGDGLSKSTLENSFYKYAYMYNQKGIKLHAMICGHFHVPITLDIMSSAGEIIVNGNIVGSNSLSIKNLQSDNKASQVCFVVEENKGITYKRKIVLD